MGGTAAVDVASSAADKNLHRGNRRSGRGGLGGRNGPGLIGRSRITVKRGG